MTIVPEIVHMQVLSLIPASLISELACFVFYDNHPKDEKNIDITICTRNGELKEFYQRDVISSIQLNCVKKIRNIQIFRNSSLELCYLVGTEDRLYIVSSKDKLHIVKIISNVQKYDVIDRACSGSRSIRVIIKDDAVPLIFNSNFEIQENIMLDPEPESDLTSQVIDKLKKKLVEAMYTTKSNEETLKEYLNIRQNVKLRLCQSLHPNLNDSVFKDDSFNILGALKIKTLNPQATVCNKKILIILEVINRYEEPIEDVHILLHTKTLLSTVYTTKIFTQLQSSPFWQENNSKTLNPGKESAVVVVMDMEGIKQNITSKIELAGAISYKISTKEYLLPFNDVLISSFKSMGDEFNVMSSNEAGDQTTILAILASTEKTKLCLRHIINQDEPYIPLQDLLCMHLQMEKVANNVLVYKKSPYHLLNGIMVVFLEGALTDKSVSVLVHARSPSQVIALLHCINDAVPSKIVATTPNYKITAKIKELSQYNEGSEVEDSQTEQNFKEYAKSILNRTTKILEHLDSSMIHMSASKNPTVQCKIGSSIDLFAAGVENFKDFRDKLLEEANKGIDCIMNKDSPAFNPDSDVMVID